MIKSIQKILVILVFLFVVCKEEDAKPDEPSAEEMIVRTWQVQSMLINGQDETGMDFSNYRFIFHPDKTYRFLMPDERQGNWELQGNATLLLLDQGTTQEESVAILELTESALILEFVEESVKLGLTQTRFSLIP